MQKKHGEKKELCLSYNTKPLSSINGEMNQLGIKYHFEQGIEKITKSKECYSFLNKDEIKKMEEENKARKLNAKRLDLRPN